jgi:hypothetical protein
MASNPSADKPQEWIITNEFAQVRLTIDNLGNDPRLKIEDLTTNLTIALDAFMLASLTTASEEELKRHMDPNSKPHPRDNKG